MQTKIEPPGNETVAAAPTPDDLAGRSYADYATDILRDRLIMLDIAPGTPLNDEAIGRALGVGRTPVREAIKRLESEHLVAIYPRRGTFAAGVDITELASITEVRVQLEPLAAARAAAHASEEERERMRALAHSLRDLDLASTDARSLMRHDLSVHRLIYRASANEHLEEVLTRFDNLSTRIWCLVVDKLSGVDAHIAEHAILLDLVADGDGERAERLAREHVISFESLVRATV